tara:strand:- start:38 stop:205 length:168 start_codon:yes stop_codon:yes gene_type:complete
MKEETDAILAASIERVKDKFIFTLVGDDGTVTKRMITDKERKRMISILKLGDLDE